MRSAYLLISHGSTDPRHQAALERLAHSTQHHLNRLLREEYQPVAAALGGITPAHLAATPSFRAFVPHGGLPPESPLVGTATLEASATPLAQQIERFAQTALEQGMRQVVLVPLFLLAGVHVQEDLPQEIAAARSRVSPRSRLVCTPYLGSHASFKQYVATRLAQTAADRCLLLAHGSRRPAGNRGIQQLGTVLNAAVAFWSVPPALETQVAQLMQQGCQRLAIAPYFLFPGGITDAITRRTEALAEQLPQLSLRLLAPLGTHGDVGKAVAELALGAPHALPHAPWNTPVRPVTESGITA